MSVESKHYFNHTVLDQLPTRGGEEHPQQHTHTHTTPGGGRGTGERTKEVRDEEKGRRDGGKGKTKRTNPNVPSDSTAQNPSWAIKFCHLELVFSMPRIQLAPDGSD